MREMKFKSYLLGTVSENERSVIDRKILTDDVGFEQLLSAEDDLIEAYLADELTATERVQFEQFFLADPDHQQRFRFINSLHRYANDPTKNPPPLVNPDSQESAHRPWWSFLPRPAWQLAMASVLLLGLFAGYRIFLNPSSPTLIANRNTSPSAPIVSSGTGVLPIELTPGVPRSRGKHLPPVTLTPNIGTVQFKLRFPRKSHPQYEVTLLPDEEGEAERKLPGRFRSETVDGVNFVLVDVPVRMLVRGDQRIRLTGVSANEPESIETYSFTVNQKSEKEK